RSQRRSVGSSTPSRSRRQYQASASSMPPPIPPTTTAAGRRSARSRPASPTASSAAAPPNRSARRPRRAPAGRATAGTSAAIRARNPSVSKSVTGPMAHRPPARPAQNGARPSPYGLTTPTPVTTTGLTGAAPSRRPSSGRLDEADEAPQRGEVLDDVVALLDHEAEALLQRDRQLDEIQGVEAQRAVHALGQGRVEGDTGEPLRLELEPLHDDLPEFSLDRVRVHQSIPPATSPTPLPPTGGRGARSSRPPTTPQGREPTTLSPLDPPGPQSSAP